ncbi:Sensor histidine kinase CssS [Thalassocella blandensis]|nr:Sensor histidine kinase CssS [Thalassocella blandensis]
MTDSKPSIDFSTVLASSVHDMKNSVGMLLASLENLIQETPPKNEEEAKRFTVLQYEASRINGELIQLLTLYRMDDSVLPVRVDQHYIIDVLEDQVARNHLLVETSEISMSLQCDEDLNWYYDIDLIGSVVHNVVLNCVRYTKSKIEISAEVEGEYLCITVADDGPGYPASMLQKPSGLLEDAADVNDGGTHLGLYFAEKIANLHTQHNLRGFIKLENGGSLGGGVFKLYIP